MSRIISILSAILLTITLLATTSYANDEDVIISVSSQTARLGDTVTLTVSIADTQDGIAGLEGKINWDTTQLTYVGSQVGSDFTTLNFNEDVQSESLGAFTVYGNNYITTGATVFTVEFKVNEEVEPETKININITGINAEYQTAGTTAIQDKTAELTIENKPVLDDIENTIPEEETTNTVQTEPTTNNNSAQTEKKDNTTAKTVLPATGMTIAIIFAIFIVLVMLVVSGKKYIQYLKDTRKQLK